MNHQPSSLNIALKNNRVGSYRLLGFVIGIIHLVILTVLLFSPNDVFTKTVAGCGIALIVVFFLIERKQLFAKEKFQSFDFLYLLLFIIWLLFGYYFITPVFVLIGVLYFISRRPSIVYFSEEGIDFPSIPRKKIQWAELSNVLLKDNLLTIDFKNNKLIQAEIEGTVDEAVFNQFATGFVV